MAEEITHMAVQDKTECRHLTKEEWFLIPIPERIQLILHNKVQFFNRDEIVPTREAVRLLKSR